MQRACRPPDLIKSLQLNVLSLMLNRLMVNHYNIIPSAHQMHALRIKLLCSAGAGYCEQSACTLQHTSKPALHECVPRSCFLSHFSSFLPLILLAFAPPSLAFHLSPTGLSQDPGAGSSQPQTFSLQNMKAELQPVRSQ